MKNLIGAIILGLSLILITSGCATKLTPLEEREYRALKNAKVLVEEKTPDLGVALGFLPGGGSFYTRKPALGVINLLLWPFSIFWEPINGHNGAKSINYHTTKAFLENERKKALGALDHKLKSGEIARETYFIEKRRIEEKYHY